MPARLLSLEAENFRSLRNVRIPLGDLTVLVGPNGVGKSNVLQVFSFLADIIRTDLQPALDSRGGFEEVAFWGGERPPSTVKIGLTATWTTHSTVNAPDHYELTIQRRALPGDGRRGRHVLLRREKFMFKRTQGRGRRISVSGQRATVTDTQGNKKTGESNIGIHKLSSGLSTLPRLASTEGGSEVTSVARRLSSLRVFDVDVDAARRPSRAQYGVGNSLAPDARNLVDFLFELSRDEDVWDRLLADARSVLPQLKEIEFALTGGSADEITVILRERGLRRPTPLADASYGTVRLLSLLALLYDPHPAALTCVEEIDHGLHPQALELLVERLREASTRSQYLVATHSPALADRLRPEELVVCERDDSGASIIPALSTEQIREIARASEELPLGELWFSGVLGGGIEQ